MISHAPAEDTEKVAFAPLRLFAAAAKSNPRAPFLRVSESEVLTYADAAGLVERAAAGLAALGVARGDRVALWLGNVPEWILSAFAVWRLGAAVVSLNPRARRGELAQLLGRCRPKALVAATRYRAFDTWTILTRALGDAFESEDQPILIAVGEGSAPGGVAFDELLAADGPVLDYLPAGADDPAVVMYTSGSTAEPKEIVRTGRQLIPHATVLAELWAIDSSESVAWLFPLCGTTGLLLALATLAAGASGILGTDGLSGEDLARRLVVEGCGFLGISDLTLRALIAAGRSGVELPCVRAGFIAVFGTADQPSLYAEAEEALGGSYVNPYGLTEANAFCIMGRLDEPLEVRCRIGGRPVGDLAVRLGQVDELLLKGSNVARRVVEEPESLAVDEEGWLHTGDVGLVEGDRYYFAGRLKDVLKVRGFIFNPGEVETAMAAYPGVEKVAVVGVPGKEGDLVVAFVSPKELDEAALLAHTRSVIASYKVPHQLVFLGELPVIEGPTGPKTDRAELRARAVEIVGRERQGGSLEQARDKEEAH